MMVQIRNRFKIGNFPLIPFSIGDKTLQNLILSCLAATLVFVNVVQSISQDAVRREQRRQPRGTRLPDGVPVAGALSASPRAGPGGGGVGPEIVSGRGRAARRRTRTHVRAAPSPGCRGRSTPPPSAARSQSQRGTAQCDQVVDATDGT